MILLPSNEINLFAGNDKGVAFYEHFHSFPEAKIQVNKRGYKIHWNVSNIPSSNHAIVQLLDNGRWTMVIRATFHHINRKPSNFRMPFDRNFGHCWHVSHKSHVQIHQFQEAQMMICINLTLSRFLWPWEISSSFDECAFWHIFFWNMIHLEIIKFVWAICAFTTFLFSISIPEKLPSLATSFEKCSSNDN